MANHRSKGGAGRRRHGRRPLPPTIDLQATELAAAEPSSHTAAGEELSAASERPAGESAGPPPTWSSPPPDDDLHATDTEADMSSDLEETAPPRRRWLWPVLGGAVAGGIVAALVLLVAWTLYGGTDRDAALRRQAKRIGEIETRVRDFAAAKATVADPAIDALSQRLDKVEAAAHAPAAAAPTTDNVAPERLSALEKTLAALKNEVAALAQRGDKTAAAVDAVRQRADTAAKSAESAQTSREQGAATVQQDIEALGARLAELERGAAAMRAELTQQQASIARQQTAAADDRPVRRAVAAEALKLAVTRGQRFRAELDAAKALASDPKPLAPLEQFAARGVPTAAALGEELGAVIPAMRRGIAPADDQGEGFLQRLQISAERLVRIHPVGENTGADAGSILARVQARAARGDIGGALAELDKLPPAVRAPADSWIGKARARDAALDASEKFAAGALAALTQRSE
jgi:hypothetical protein